MIKKLLIISVHPVLEHDERSLFQEMGHQCFSLGFFSNFDGRFDASLRVPFPESEFTHNCRTTFLETNCSIAYNESCSYRLTYEFVSLFDAIIIHHNYSFIEVNWDVIGHLPVIWRTIGQELSTPEDRLSPYRKKGLYIVRWSSEERKILRYIGEDAIIHAAKRPTDFCQWVGGGGIVTFNNNFTARRSSLSFDFFESVAARVPISLYGLNNSDVAQWKGLLSYSEQLKVLSLASAAFVTGTWPSPYTLGFIEAWMAGAPVVHVGQQIWGRGDDQCLLEAPNLIENHKSGFVVNSVEEAVSVLNELGTNLNLSTQISLEGRRSAEHFFGWERAKSEWSTFFSQIF